MDDLSKINALYNEGKKEFLDGKYYDAHEVWEDLWSDYYLKDRKFIQGLIQLSVSFVHLKNGNMVGAKNLLKKEMFTRILSGETQRQQCLQLEESLKLLNVIIKKFMFYM